MFQSQSLVSDGGGGSVRTWVTALTVWGRFTPQSGTETLQAGRPENSVVGTLRIRRSSEANAIDQSYRVQIESIDYQIRSIINPDQRDRWLDMTVERGVAL